MGPIWPEGVYYAKPREISDVRECYFYHTMEIPAHGLVEGQWDLRAGIREYTGGIDFKGQRVLEIGTASGFVCFYMEQQGADVVAYDLSDKYDWDLVPLASVNSAGEAAARRAIIRRINDGFWLAHKALRSKASVVYGTVYEIPSAIGLVDISTFCSVLLHVRDPFLALFNAARLTKKTMLVTDVVSADRNTMSPPGSRGRPLMEFIPHAKVKEADIWWNLSPEAVVEFLRVLGFEDTRVTYHTQPSIWGEKSLFSVVGHRTRGTSELN